MAPKRIRRLFGLMNYKPIYKKDSPNWACKIYIKPYLLRGIGIERPNQV